MALNYIDSPHRKKDFRFSDRTKKIALISVISLYYFSLKLLIFSKGRIFFDEGVYMGIAQYFASFGEYGIFEIFRPLMLSFLLTPLQVTGLNSLMAARIFSLILAICSGLIVYHVAKRHFGAKPAMISFFLYMTGFSILLYGGYVLVDIFAYVFALLGISYFSTNHFFRGGLFVAIGFLFKFPAAFVFPFFIIYLIVEYLFSKKTYLKETFLNILRCGIGFSLGILPYFLFNFFYYDGGLVDRMTTPLLSASNIVASQSWLYKDSSFLSYFFQLATTETVPLILFIVGVYFIIRDFVSEQKKNKTTGKFFSTIKIIGFAFIYFIYFCIFLTRYDSRYALIFIFLFYVISGEAFFRIIKNLPKKRLILYFFIILIIILSLGNTFHLTRDNYKIDKTITDAISNSDILVTNSAFVFPYHPKTTLKPGPNYEYTFIDYMLGNFTSFALDVYGYPCHEMDDFCVDQYQKQLNYLVDSNNIMACGKLHGFNFIVIDKYENSRLSSSLCLEKVNVPRIENITSSHFVRLDIDYINLSQKENKDIIKDLSKLTEVYLTVTNFSDNFDSYPYSMEFLRNLSSNISYTLFQKDIGYKDEFEISTGKKITAIASVDDDFKENNIYIPEDIEICLRGGWDMTYLGIPCETIDIVFIERNGFENEKERIYALKNGDYRIGIEIPIDYLRKNKKEFFELMKELS
ncbi:MAG: ArnT family glycosyltransferase [Candidatus Woesearchaeota archaeon]